MPISRNIDHSRLSGIHKVKRTADDASRTLADALGSGWVANTVAVAPDQYHMFGVGVDHQVWQVHIALNLQGGKMIAVYRIWPWEVKKPPPGYFHSWVEDLETAAKIAYEHRISVALEKLNAPRPTRAAVDEHTTPQPASRRDQGSSSQDTGGELEPANHLQMVRGIVRSIKAASGGKTFTQVWSAATADADGWSETYLEEWVKDGVGTQTQAQTDAVLLGDYAWIWEFVNNFLARRGIERIEPIEFDE